MKARVIMSFRDKNTKALHKIGDEITISKERFEEINSAAPKPFLEKIKEKKPAKK